MPKIGLTQPSVRAPKRTRESPELAPENRKRRESNRRPPPMFLRVISRAPFDLEAVFATLIETAAKLCRGLTQSGPYLLLKDNQASL